MYNYKVQCLLFVLLNYPAESQKSYNAIFSHLKKTIQPLSIRVLYYTILRFLTKMSTRFKGLDFIKKNKLICHFQITKKHFIHYLSQISTVRVLCKLFESTIAVALLIADDIKKNIMTNASPEYPTICQV